MENALHQYGRIETFWDIIPASLENKKIYNFDKLYVNIPSPSIKYVQINYPKGQRTPCVDVCCWGEDLYTKKCAVLIPLQYLYTHNNDIHRVKVIGQYMVNIHATVYSVLRWTKCDYWAWRMASNAESVFLWVHLCIGAIDSPKYSCFILSVLVAFGLLCVK